MRIGGGSAAGEGFALFRGGAMEKTSLRLAEVAHGGGTLLGAVQAGRRER